MKWLLAITQITEDPILTVPLQSVQLHNTDKYLLPPISFEKGLDFSFNHISNRSLLLWLVLYFFFYSAKHIG